MTLILALTSRYFALAVSDRLVTAGGQSFDQASNKAVLFLGDDCTVTLGYTGLAFLEGMNTDQWIVEQIVGKPLNVIGAPSALSGFSSTSQSKFLANTVATLEGALNQYFASPGKRHDKVSSAFEVHLSGWYWGRKRRPRAVAVAICKQRGETTFSVRWSPRHYSRNTFTISAVGERLTSTERDQMIARVAKASTLEEREHALVDTIRRVSDRLRTVGADCMSILSTPPAQRLCVVRYHPSVPYAYQSEGAVVGGQSRSTPAVHTPWVLSSTFVHAPSVLVGLWTLNLSGRQVVLEAPLPAAGGLDAAMIPARRTREPR